jgi:FtsP/CotA-like multicopper oxidase with cupredoxin domain
MPLLKTISICLVLMACPLFAGAIPEILENENRVPAGRLEAGILSLHLELRQGVWRPDTGGASGRAASYETPNAIEAYSFAEEGHAPQIPGPLIRVRQGTEIHVSTHNLLATAVFIHGLNQHPGDDQNVLQLAPGETKQLSFLAGEPGSYLYWAATSAQQPASTDGTMAGAFIVDPPFVSSADRVFLIQFWSKNIFTQNFQGALTINGKSWPSTERLQANVGRPEHWRVLNATPIPHPMHLHGFYFRVDATGDGESEKMFSVSERRMVVTETVVPGHTFDMTWVPERPGNWIFHCHILDHMSHETSPVMYGIEGPPVRSEHGGEADHTNGMGMSKLVLGITVKDDVARNTSAIAATPSVADERHLFVRERPASLYVPAGPGFYLEGVSRGLGAIGPPLVITRGQRTAITVHNELSEPTAIHWHGLEIESYYDGVPGWDGTAQNVTPSIAPGKSFVAYMTPPRAGTFIYHTHWHDVRQLTGGMYGALLVLEPGQKYDPATDKVFVLGRSGANEMHDPLVLNGSPQPGLMVLLPGQKYRFRFINITPNEPLVEVSLTSGGRPVKWRPLAKDGFDLPAAQRAEHDAVQAISVGETFDFEFAPQAPGDFLLRFSSPFGSEVAQGIAVVSQSDPFSVYATARH